MRGRSAGDPPGCAGSGSWTRRCWEGRTGSSRSSECLGYIVDEIRNMNAFSVGHCLSTTRKVDTETNKKKVKKRQKNEEKQCIFQIINKKVFDSTSKRIWISFFENKMRNIKNRAWPRVRSYGSYVGAPYF